MTLNDGVIVNDGLGKMLNKAVITYFETAQHLNEVSRENHKKHQNSGDKADVQIQIFPM
jgi:hypothetical protein